jgi:RecA/RadA recombinase
MAKAFDISKFRRGLTKSVKGLSVGFRDPNTWISTGNYTLNRLISGDFFKGVPLGKVTMFAGESGAGKSFICSGNLVKDAQDQGVFVILIDSENALDEKWLHALSVDTSEGKLLKLNMAMIDDVGKTISDFVNSYREDYGTVPDAERPAVLFVVDSLGMLMSPTEIAQFEAGDMKGDFGRKAKQLKALVTNCVNMFGD